MSNNAKKILKYKPSYFKEEKKYLALLFLSH